jgi:CrcB protein
MQSGYINDMLKWVLIAVGGAFGSVLRYAVQGVFGSGVGARFPIGTIVVNLSGCLLIGLLAGFFDGPRLVREEYRAGLLVGVLGGYTTFSSFGLETFRLASDGQWRLALVNMVLSCVVGFVAVWVGYRMAERWFGV